MGQSIAAPLLYPLHHMPPIAASLLHMFILSCPPPLALLPHLLDLPQLKPLFYRVAFPIPLLNFIFSCGIWQLSGLTGLAGIRDAGVAGWAASANPGARAGCSMRGLGQDFLKHFFNEFDPLIDCQIGSLLQACHRSCCPPGLGPDPLVMVTPAGGSSNFPMPNDHWGQSLAMGDSLHLSGDQGSGAGFQEAVLMQVPGSAVVCWVLFQVGRAPDPLLSQGVAFQSCHKFFPTFQLCLVFTRASHDSKDCKIPMVD